MPLPVLSLLAFPQFWDGTSLNVRFLCLPRNGLPVAPLRPGLPSFQDAALVFRACLAPGLTALPTSAAAAAVGPLTLAHPPTAKALLFDQLAQQLEISMEAPPSPPPPPWRRQVLKVAPHSYLEAIGGEARSPYLRSDSDYACALNKSTNATSAAAGPATLRTSLRWGQAISQLLRQPLVAESFGLIGDTTFSISPEMQSNGGWVWIELHDSSDVAAVPGLAVCYAARVPPLPSATHLSLFSASLFPVDAPTSSDEAYREAELYQDGVAKVVHGAQQTARAADSEARDRGDRIQLGWDDEQIATWLNRMIDSSGGGSALREEAPCGVAGYRVDVREKGSQTWASLMRIRSRGPLTLGTQVLGAFEGEGIIEVLPTRPAAATDGTYWVPPYFASWRGGSLALTASALSELHQHTASHVPAGVHPSLAMREQVFETVADSQVPLRYGKTYEFRVRLADLTRGGPKWDHPDGEHAGTSILSIPFRRTRQPGAFTHIVTSGTDASVITLDTPRLGYPEALFAGSSLDALKDDIDAIAGALEVSPDAVTREAGIIDPDVTAVGIRVSIRRLSGDGDSFSTLYETQRPLTGEHTRLTVTYRRCDSLSAFVPPTTGDIVVPTARDVRLTFTALCEGKPDYFASPEVRIGLPSELTVRREEPHEGNVLVAPSVPHLPLQAFYFQPPRDMSAPPAAHLARVLDLDVDGASLYSRPGSRVVMGCSAGLPHVLSPERSVISFASAGSLVSKWVTVIRLSLARDWTWDGMANAGIAITRIMRVGDADERREQVGELHIPRAVSPRALIGPGSEDLDIRAVHRQATELVFFDAFSPTLNDGTPAPITVRYELEKRFVSASSPAPSDLPINLSIDLPIATPPTQVPELVSAGFALSPYSRSADYSSSEPRRQSLWLEFNEPPRRPGDAFFVRVLAAGPDPVLLEPSHSPLSEDDEPGLAVDPEWMRHVVPGQPHDASGLAAMERLVPAPGQPTLFTVPLPPGLTENSPELFGFFTYEVRVGHAEGWTTAQGRFGPPLRVSGVQHPAPALACDAGRDENRVTVRSRYAAAVWNGQNRRAKMPHTTVWAQLYARVQQVDGATWRNVLLASAALQPEQGVVDAGLSVGGFTVEDIRKALAVLGLPADTPLTVMTAETFGQATYEHALDGWEPLGRHLGRGRILRTSRLVPVPDVCC